MEVCKTILSLGSESMDSLSFTRGWLAENRADDAEPITEAWLETIKGSPPREFGREPRYDLGDVTLFRDAETKEWVFQLRGFVGSRSRKMKTRGDVRLLCIALGVPFREAE